MDCCGKIDWWGCRGGNIPEAEDADEDTLQMSDCRN